MTSDRLKTHIVYSMSSFTLWVMKEFAVLHKLSAITSIYIPLLIGSDIMNSSKKLVHLGCKIQFGIPYIWHTSTYFIILSHITYLRYLYNLFIQCDNNNLYEIKKQFWNDFSDVSQLLWQKMRTLHYHTFDINLQRSNE